MKATDSTVRITSAGSIATSSLVGPLTIASFSGAVIRTLGAWLARGADATRTISAQPIVPPITAALHRLTPSPAVTAGASSIGTSGPSVVSRAR